MISMTFEEIAHAVHGEITAQSALDQFATLHGRVVHDSRTVQPGDLFVAISGDTYDGHDFVADAFEAGAIAAIVELPLPGATIRVTSTMEALSKLATAVIDRAFGLTVIAITGSSGKTSTKDLLAQVLAAEGPTVAPLGSLNNEIGLPMTVLSIDRHTKYLVLEMGARGKGHIKTLCDIAKPDIGIVLNVGSAHLGEFGSVEEIAQTKGELIAALPPYGKAVLNFDDTRVAAMRGLTEVDIYTFGTQAGATVQLMKVELDELARPTIRLKVPGSGAMTVTLNAHGAHQAMNAAAIFAASQALRLPYGSVAKTLRTASVGSRWRMEVTQTADGTTIINDAYNANPESTAAALHALAAMSNGRTTWAVLGEMRELGEASISAHRNVGELARELGINRLVSIGGDAATIIAGGQTAGYSADEARAEPGIPAAAALLAAEVTAGDVILVKASRAVGLEKLAEQLIAAHGGAA